MNSRQSSTLRVFMSIAMGTIAFCLTVPVVSIVGGILMSRLGLLDGGGLIPTGLAILFLISILMGLIVGVLVEIKYYRYMENSPNR